MNISKKKTFTANGTEYKVLDIETAMTAARYFAYERLKFEYSFDMSPETVALKMSEVEAIINGIVTGQDRKRNLLHATTILYGLIEILRKPSAMSQSKAAYMMKICTLFIVVKDEDLAQWTEAQAQQKIDDWVSEGLNVVDFFTLGIAAVRKLNNALASAMEIG